MIIAERFGEAEPQMAAPGNVLRDAEIERDRLGVADVQIAVRLRRKSGHDPAMLFGVEIGLDDVANEIAPRLRRRFCRHLMFPPAFKRTFCQIRPVQPSAVPRIWGAPKA